jgi:hypothetical protein
VGRTLSNTAVALCVTGLETPPTPSGDGTSSTAGLQSVPPSPDGASVGHPPLARRQVRRVLAPTQRHGHGPTRATSTATGQWLPRVPSGLRDRTPLSYLIRIDRAADQAPALPSARLARTRQNRSPAAVRAAETCDAVTVRVRTTVEKVLEAPTCRV